MVNVECCVVLCCGVRAGSTSCDARARLVWIIRVAYDDVSLADIEGTFVFQGNGCCSATQNIVRWWYDLAHWPFFVRAGACAMSLCVYVGRAGCCIVGSPIAKSRARILLLRGMLGWDQRMRVHSVGLCSLYASRYSNAMHCSRAFMQCLIWHDRGLLAEMRAIEMISWNRTSPH